MQVIGATPGEARASQRGLPLLTNSSSRTAGQTRNVAALAGVIRSKVVNRQGIAHMMDGERRARDPREARGDAVASHIAV